jgi:phenylalanyl-tRNA synthetase beta chain
MRISAQWLNELITTPDVDELAHVFEMAGIGVEDRDGDVFTLEVTSNRGDWLSAIGLAREIGALTDKFMHMPGIDLEEAGDTIEKRVTVHIENPDDCPRYVARLIEGVQIGPSPDWMQRRLIECGMRPINNIVDITNYVMLETGQPLHAFDADKIPGGQIVVRRARAGETLRTLDDVERQLNEEILVIADGEKPIAVAGVMGGFDSEVTNETTNILLESAHFQPARVRRGARGLGLNSEASRRFERWVDPNGTHRAADRAAQLLQQYAGGTVAEGAVDRYVQPIVPAAVEMRVTRCNALLGLHLKAETMAQLLERLAFKVTVQGGEDEEVLHVEVPTFRRDITREIDLIEEVARVHGYDAIPTTLPPGANTTAGLSLAQRLEERAKSALLRCGLSEIVTYSLQNEAAVQRAGMPPEDVVKLRNPLSEDYSQLRTSLIPSLLEALEKNARHGARLFELGKVYLPRPGHKQPDERSRIGIALMDGVTAQPHWQKRSTSIDFFTLKAVIETMLDEIGAPSPRFQPVANPPFHPGRCAAVSIDAQDVALLGEVHPEVVARYDLTNRAYLAVIDFDAVVRHLSLIKKYTPLPRFPVIDRDLALVLRADVLSADVEAVLRDGGGELLRSVQTFDVYSGPPIPEGFKSLALALRFRAEDRTLTDAEVDASMAKIRAAAERAFDARVRE